MSESSDYKRGWYDGYQAGRNSLPQSQPFMPMPIGTPKIACTKCGIDFTGSMGYVCPRQDCVIQPKITASANKETL